MNHRGQTGGALHTGWVRSHWLAQGEAGVGQTAWGVTEQLQAAPLDKCMCVGLTITEGLRINLAKAPRAAMPTHD